VSYRPVAVFNAADLEGAALEALIEKRRQAEGLSQRPEPVRLAAAEAVLSCWPVPVSFGGDRACYLAAADRIALPDRAAFHSAAALYATWAHEAIHSSGHSSRLARDLSGLSDVARVDAAPERQLQAMLLPSPIRSDSLFQADRLDPALRDFILLITILMALLEATAQQLTPYQPPILMAFPGLLRQEPTW
jgi:hypothetical protein